MPRPQSISAKLVNDPSASAPWKVKVVVAWDHRPQPAPGFYS